MMSNPFKVIVSAEDGDTLVKALRIMQDHATAVRESGHPQGASASEAIANKMLPFAELVLMMCDHGIIQSHDETPDEMLARLEAEFRD